MHVRESLNLDNNRSSAGLTSTSTAIATTTMNSNSNMGPPLTTTTTTITTPLRPHFASAHHGYIISRTTLLLLGAFFVCTLFTVSCVIYNFTTCDQLEMNPDVGEDALCSSMHLKHSVKTHGTQRYYDHDTDDSYGDDDNGDSAGGNADVKRSSKYDKDVRLPKAIKPLRYNISLIPYLEEENFTFEGEVEIDIYIVEDTYNITMHATELNISKSDVSVYVKEPNLNKPNRFLRDIQNRDNIGKVQELRIRKQYMVDAKQFLIIELYDKLKKDLEYKLHIKFNGIIKDLLQGFYRSSYQVGNKTKWLGSTQFQATDARRAFPCFDEPALKAIFTLNIARPSHMSVISNMPIVSTQKHETVNNYVWDNFADSVPMSTYLIAYVISDFKRLRNGTFSVWARQGAISSTQYALSIGPKILKFLEEYFHIKFPLPKMDMVALPEFQAGAMENWGLITFRESTMLFEEGVSAITDKQRIATVVGHELAHQWFGNLVTPSWWSDIWLNEGFASYMEYLTVDAVEPSWRTLDQFVVNELQNVFQLDALSTSHKISVEVFNPEEITEIFDRISYDKGATIIRMMSHFLTSEVFRRGLSKYLQKMAYNSAEQDDLWRFLTIEAIKSGLLDNTTSVKQIMDTWTLQIGFPVVKISRHPNTNMIRMEQERFVYVNDSDSRYRKKSNNRLKEKPAYTPLWWIPITYTWSDELNFENTRPITWMPQKKVYEIEDRNLSIAKWYIFNIQQTNYYRVNYDLENWNAIIEHLMQSEHYKEIVPANRAQLIDDAMNLARGGYLSYTIAMNMSRYLKHEDDHVPWKAAIGSFNFIDSMFVNQGDYDLLKNYILKLLTNVYNEVGFIADSNSKDVLKLFKRFEILNMACHFGHRHCISESIRHFQNWLQVPNPDNMNPISPNLRGIVYCTAIQYGTEFEWNFAFERYLKSTVSAEKELLLGALGCSREPWILVRYLRLSISGAYIRKQDVFRVFSAISRNAVGQQIVFDFIRNNWREIKDFLGVPQSTMNTILKYCTKRMNTKFSLANLEDFVRQNEDIKENGRGSQQIIEEVRINVDWVDHNYKPIVEWLKLQKDLKSL